MKIRLSLFCIALALFACNFADAQLVRSQQGGPFAQAGFRQVSGDLLQPQAGGRIGRLWFETNVVDQGLGYQGSYLSLGGKTRLGEDALDGRWLMEGRVHHSLEDEGGLFANIGIERVFSIKPANADIAIGVWYDYDGDRQAAFAHTFHQVGVSGAIKTRRWDLIANGYIPTGIQDYSLGDPSGSNPFFGNSIALTPGIDSALQGFDVTLRVRPKQLAFGNGHFDIGGYHYNSDLIDAFAGVKARVGAQVLGGMMVNLEVNHDDRFDTTAVLGVGWVFGATGSAYGSEYSALGRDLEQTVRNDHIVRFNQDVVIATDPRTGAAYNAVHVDNNADPAFADGSAELPFASLVAAQNNSSEGDVIVVNAGDGTDRSLRSGIVLKDDQYLLGEGRPILLPIQNGQNFQLFGNSSGLTPTISNDGGFAVVTLANRNNVGGLDIDATGAQFGIWGGDIEGGDISDNTIQNSAGDGVRLARVSGDWNFQRNTIASNNRDGMVIIDALDNTSNFHFESNTVSDNLFEGIHIRNLDPASATFLTNNTSNNLRHGLYVENFMNTAGGGLSIQRHTSDGNVGAGIFLNEGNGQLGIINSTITNNGGSGVLVRNWATADPDRININETEGGVSNISGNGGGGNLQFLLDQPGIQSRVVVTNQTLDDGNVGVAARVEGVDGAGLRSTLDIDIVDNDSINNNLNDGIRLLAQDGGLIRANIGSSNPDLLQPIVGNARGGGDGISLTARGLNGQPPGEIQAMVDSVFINNLESRIIRPGLPDIVVFTDGIGITSIENGFVNVLARRSTIGAPNGTTNETQTGVNIFVDNEANGVINRIVLDEMTMFNDIGVDLFTGDDTMTDFVLVNSTLLPMGAQSTAGTRSDNNPFTDAVGSHGVRVTANGRGLLTGTQNVFLPNSPFALDGSILETISDGLFDNLTRVTLQDNVIQDFTFEGIDITTTGDAQMSLALTGNTVNNNGAGFNDDTDNNNVFDDITVGAADPNNLFFYDGVNIDAFDQSTISTRIVGNSFQDNFERGLSLNTFNVATINASVIGNTFFGNDRGEDLDNTIPPIGTGTAAGPTGALNDSGEFDFEAVNNEEFYIRFYETQILINGAGTPIDLAGADLPADTPGFFFPINTGADVFGLPVAVGRANLNLSMSSNSLQLGPELLDFSAAPGEFNLGLDGLTNGFGGGFFGIQDVPFLFTESIIVGEEGVFTGAGFLPSPH
ncbi:MAG: right-handed parallel beta-helix repeat-containing protein [Mariniblastus sp.]